MEKIIKNTDKFDKKNPAIFPNIMDRIFRNKEHKCQVIVEHYEINNLITTENVVIMLLNGYPGRIADKYFTAELAVELIKAKFPTKENVQILRDKVTPMVGGKFWNVLAYYVPEFVYQALDLIPLPTAMILYEKLLPMHPGAEFRKEFITKVVHTERIMFIALMRWDPNDFAESLALINFCNFEKEEARNALK